MRRLTRAALACCVLIAVVLVPLPAAAEQHLCAANGYNCPQPTASADQANARVVTAGVVAEGALAGSGVAQAVAGSAGCADCVWSVEPLCQGAAAGVEGMCQNAVLACPPPQVAYRVFLRRGAGPAVLVGQTCLGAVRGGGAGPPGVGARVREVVATYLPDAAPSFQPAAGAVVNLPTLFAAGEPATVTTEPFEVAGFTVVVSATASWWWEFEPGVRRMFTRPGGAYPNTDVAYTYPSLGARVVRLTTTWRATYTVDGAGPFPVPGEAITKTADPLRVPVRAARAVLVGG